MTNQTWQVSGELEFQALMEDIDADMHQSQTPIPRREFEAIKLLRKRLGADHSLLLSDLPEKPQAGVYAGRDLTKRVFNWIEERYGDRLKSNFGPGATAVSIRGDVYPVVLPFVMGNFSFICDPTKFTERQPNNVLNYIRGLQPALAISLSTQELDLILDQIKEAFKHLTQIMGTAQGAVDQNAKVLIEEARSDLAAAVEHMVRAREAFGGARYHSEQATEKFIKALLCEKGIAYSTRASEGHNLRKLVGLAHSFITLSSASLAAATCGSGVRYGKPPSTLSEALEAHRASLSICATVAKAIGLVPVPLNLK
jgi:hypothetical protein